MAGLSPEEVVELKHSLEGMADLVHVYYRQLIGQGFTAEEALRITIGWQSAVLRMGLEG